MSEIIEQMRAVLRTAHAAGLPPDEWVMGRDAYSSLRVEVEPILAVPSAQGFSSFYGIAFRESSHMPPWSVAAMLDGRVVGAFSVKPLPTPPAP